MGVLFEHYHGVLDEDEIKNSAPLYIWCTDYLLDNNNAPLHIEQFKKRLFKSMIDDTCHFSNPVEKASST